MIRLKIPDKTIRAYFMKTQRHIIKYLKKENYIGDQDLAVLNGKVRECYFSV
jgi:hypothetical protein